jgi:hypothetical protein
MELIKVTTDAVPVEKWPDYQKMNRELLVFIGDSLSKALITGARRMKLTCELVYEEEE